LSLSEHDQIINIIRASIINIHVMRIASDYMHPEINTIYTRMIYCRLFQAHNIEFQYHICLSWLTSILNLFVVQLLSGITLQPIILLR